MQKYFISSSDLIKNIILGDDVFHIKNVMRGRIGDHIIVSDEQQEYLVEITAIEKNKVKFDILKERHNQNELPVEVCLIQGFPKGDKLEEIIKTSTQLGITEIIPTLMKRSVVKVDFIKSETKTIRWNKIAKEASEQADRKRIPLVSPPKKLKELNFSHFTHKMVCYEESAKNNEQSNFKQVLSSLIKGDKLCVVVGPEGGLDEEEIIILEKQGFICCGLGPRILRTETAITYVLASVSYEVELK